MRLAIIVPYRDRRDEMDIFIPHMESFLTNKQIDYKIFIAEQSDDRPFNYGKLCNSIVNEIKNDYDYFCFHDIDLLPMNDDADYSYKEKPTQLIFEDENGDNIIPYDEYFGGVVIFNKEDFIKINGFANDYWGKGYVDLDLLYRSKMNDLKLVKFYDYNTTKSLKLDLKGREIVKNVSIIKLNPKTLIKTHNSDILSSDFTISLHYKQEILKESKNTIIRTHNGFDFQIFTYNTDFIIQFFDKEEIFQMEINDINLLKLNHYTFIHDSTEKTFTVYVNNILKIKKKYDINYEYSIKNVILGDTDNTNTIEFINFKLFMRVLNNTEVLRNYYYGLTSDGFEFNQTSFYKELGVFLDKRMLKWYCVGVVELEGRENLKLPKIKLLPNRIKGSYKLLNPKFDEIEDTYDPDILENKRTYFNDLLNGKIKINKYGLESVKYTLLNKIDFNENTEWYKVSI
jgi:hypothetical protein